jgi:hypothetical protein
MCAAARGEGGRRRAGKREKEERRKGEYSIHVSKKNEYSSPTPMSGGFPRPLHPCGHRPKSFPFGDMSDLERGERTGKGTLGIRSSGDKVTRDDWRGELKSLFIIFPRNECGMGDAQAENQRG